MQSPSHENHVERHVQIVKELKERDDHDKIQDRESVNLSRKSVLGFSVSCVRPTGWMSSQNKTKVLSKESPPKQNESFVQRDESFVQRVLSKIVTWISRKQKPFTRWMVSRARWVSTLSPPDGPRWQSKPIRQEVHTVVMVLCNFSFVTYPDSWDFFVCHVCL